MGITWISDMYDAILLPTDGSQGSKAAIRHGIEIASQWNATLHGLYVVDTTVARSISWKEALWVEGEQAVDDIRVVGTQASLNVVTDVVEGIPHEEILSYVADHGINLIVMGTHGRSGLDRLVMGSVAERVVRLSPIPVLTVRQEEESQ